MLNELVDKFIAVIDNITVDTAVVPVYKYKLKDLTRRSIFVRPPDPERVEADYPEDQLGSRTFRITIEFQISTEVIDEVADTVWLVDCLEAVIDAVDGSTRLDDVRVTDVKPVRSKIEYDELDNGQARLLYNCELDILAFKPNA